MQSTLKTKLSTASTLALALCLCSAPAWADSTSSASSAASTSVGSSSTSLETSSAGSSGKGQVAQGNYTVIDIGAVDGAPDMLRVRLQAATSSQAADHASSRITEFALLIPRQTLERTQLATGQTVHAEHRPYGLAFATVATIGTSTAIAQPFFLVLDDAWHRELQSRPVTTTEAAAQWAAARI